MFCFSHQESSKRRERGEKRRDGRTKGTMKEKKGRKETMDVERRRVQEKQGLKGNQRNVNNNINEHLTKKNEEKKEDKELTRVVIQSAKPSHLPVLFCFLFLFS